MSEFVPTTEEVRQSFVYAESSEFVATVPGNGNDAWARVPASGDVKATRVRDGKIQSEATAEFDRWLAALIREAKAEAWGEGYDEWAQAPAGDQPPRDNPYREGSET